MSTVEALERIANPANDEGFAAITSGRFSIEPITSIAREALPQARLEAKVIEAARSFVATFDASMHYGMDARIEDEARGYLVAALDALREGE